MQGVASKLYAPAKIVESVLPSLVKKESLFTVSDDESGVAGSNPASANCEAEKSRSRTLGEQFHGTVGKDKAIAHFFGIIMKTKRYTLYAINY